MATNSGRWGQSVKLKITFETQNSHFKCDFGSRDSHLKRTFPLSNMILDFQSGACSPKSLSPLSDFYQISLIAVTFFDRKSLIAVSDSVRMRIVPPPTIALPIGANLGPSLVLIR